MHNHNNSERMMASAWVDCMLVGIRWCFHIEVNLYISIRILKKHRMSSTGKDFHFTDKIAKCDLLGDPRFLENFRCGQNITSSIDRACDISWRCVLSIVPKTSERRNFYFYFTLQNPNSIHQSVLIYCLFHFDCIRWVSMSMNAFFREP